MGDDIVAEACKILTVYKHCRRQAKQLSACRSTLGASSSGSAASGSFFAGADPCARQTAAFKTCSEERLEPVIADLMKVAARKCPAQVRAFEQCKRRTMSNVKCEFEDLRAMECAARHVVASAALSSS